MVVRLVSVACVLGCVNVRVILCVHGGAVFSHLFDCLQGQNGHHDSRLEWLWPACVCLCVCACVCVCYVDCDVLGLR